MPIPVTIIVICIKIKGRMLEINVKCENVTFLTIIFIFSVGNRFCVTFTFATLACG